MPVQPILSPRPRGAAHDRHRPHHRFRQPGHAVDRAARARAGRLLRDRALQQGRRGAGAAQAQGRDPVGRPGQRHRVRHAARARLGVQGRPAGARHLLRRADHGGADGRRRRRRPPPRVRPRRVRGDGRHRAVRRRVEEGRARHRVDEPRRPRHAAAGRLQGGRHIEGRAVRGHRRREAQALRRAVPSRGGAHAEGRPADRQLRAPHRRPAGRLEHGAFPLERDRQDPRPGRQGPRHLRPVGRRRQRGGGRADPRGDRRPAHLHLRRPRPAAAERGQGGGVAVPRPLQHSAGARRCQRALPGGAGRE